MTKARIRITAASRMMILHNTAERERERETERLLVISKINHLEFFDCLQFVIPECMYKLPLLWSLQE